MAGEGTKRIVDLTETSEVQSGDYIAIDSTARGTKKTPVSVFAKAADLTAEQTARAAADTTLDGKITAEQTAREAADNTLGGQVSDLKSELSDIGVEMSFEQLTLTKTDGYYINSSGVITSTAGNYSINKCAVTEGYTYYITGSANWSAPLFAYYDSEMGLVEIGDTSGEGSTVTSISDVASVAPTGAAFLVVEAISSGSAAAVKESDGSYIFPRLDAVEAEASLISDIVTQRSVSLGGTTLDSKYVNGSGVIGDAAGNYHILKVEVEAGKTYYVDASANWSSPFYAFYDASMVYLQKSATSSAGTSAFTSIENEAVVAPNNAKYICINYSGTSTIGKISTLTEPMLVTKWENLKWACVGDSLTAINSYTTKRYFDYIAEATGIIPINMGVSGSGYARMSESGDAFYQRISNCPLDVAVVTIFGSFNDLGAGLSLGSYSDTGTSTVAGCINTTLDNLYAILPTVVVGIVAPTPWQTTQPIPESGGYNYVKLLKEITEYRSVPFLDLYRESNLRPWDADFRPLCYSNDGGAGTHPNELGHKIIAPKFEAFLDMLLIH